MSLTSPSRTGKSELVALKVLNSQIEQYPRPKARSDCALLPLPCPWCARVVTMHTTLEPPAFDALTEDGDRITHTRLKVPIPTDESPGTGLYIHCPLCAGYVQSNGRTDWERADAEHAEVTDFRALFRCRPCLFAACENHLYTDINPRTGSLKINFPDLEPVDLDDSCTLDGAEHGPMTLELISRAMNLTKERTRQIEAKAFAKLRQRPDVNDLHDLTATR